MISSWKLVMKRMAEWFLVAGDRSCVQRPGKADFVALVVHRR